MEAQDDCQLLLDWDDVSARHDGSERVLQLGADPAVDLCVAGRFTSRRHATIERRKQDFVLVDHSANGTYVQTEDEHVTHVHRGVLRLWGDGWLSLGEPLSATSAVRFRSR